MKCDKCKETECKHENVKYYPCCMKVRCENCGQEWVTGVGSYEYWDSTGTYSEPQYTYTHNFG